MALFVIERNYAEQLQLTDEDARLVTEVNNGAGVHWLFSFLSADKKKTYCVYEAPNAEAIREAARRACPRVRLCCPIVRLREHSRGAGLGRTAPRAHNPAIA